MKIGIVSDTHSRPIPPQLVSDFKKVDMIIHAGDFCSLNDYQFFAQIKDLKAVWGNVDEPSLRHKLPARLVFSCDGVAIGVYHGDGPSQRIIESVTSKFQNDRVEVIIFGHSHQPMNEKINHVLYFNPGSPTDLVIAPYRSYGILEIKNNDVAGKIIKLKD